MICVVTTDFIYINFRPKNDAKIGDKCLLWIMIERPLNPIHNSHACLVIYLSICCWCCSFSLFRLFSLFNIMYGTARAVFNEWNAYFLLLEKKLSTNRSFLYMVFHQSCQFIWKGPTLTHTHIHKRTRTHIHPARIYPCRNIQNHRRW